jgi:hypothetical protein
LFLQLIILQSNLLAYLIKLVLLLLQHFFFALNFSNKYFYCSQFLSELFFGLSHVCFELRPCLFDLFNFDSHVFQFLFAYFCFFVSYLCYPFNISNHPLALSLSINNFVSNQSYLTALLSLILVNLLNDFLLFLIILILSLNFSVLQFPHLLSNFLLSHLNLSFFVFKLSPLLIKC